MAPTRAIVVPNLLLFRRNLDRPFSVVIRRSMMMAFVFSVGMRRYLLRLPSNWLSLALSRAASIIRA